MIEYLLQLERLKALKPHLVFPSHGPVVATAMDAIEATWDRIDQGRSNKFGSVSTVGTERQGGRTW